MTGKIFSATLVAVATAFITVPAFAAINQPAGHAQGSTYEECGVECNEFIDSKACVQFRRTNLICTEKKKSTWPILTAQMLEEMEC